MYLQIWSVVCIALIIFVVYKIVNALIKYRKFVLDEREFNRKYSEWWHSQKEVFARSERFIKKWEGIYGHQFLIGNPFRFKYGAKESTAKRYPTEYFHYYNGEIVFKYMVCSRLAGNYSHRTNISDREYKGRGFIQIIGKNVIGVPNA